MVCSGIQGIGFISVSFDLRYKFNILFTVLWLFFAGYSYSNQKDIRQSSAVVDALRYYYENQIQFENIGAESGISAQLVYSIVAP